MVEAGGDASGFAGADVVVGSFVLVGVCPAVCGQQAVPVGGGVVARAGEVGVVEEVVVVSWFGSVNLGLDGEEVDEPGGCVGWFEVGDGVAVLEGVLASVFVCGWWWYICWFRIINWSKYIRWSIKIYKRTRRL